MNKPYKNSAVLAAAVAAVLFAAAPAHAQNVTLVNGKAVPKARVDALMQQAIKQGQPKTPELEVQMRDEVVLREMLMQEAEKRGLTGSAEYKRQMEAARQTILIRELFSQYQGKNPVTDAEIAAEYERLKTQSAGLEYRARHILVETEDQGKALIAQLKGGAKFEDLAKKNSKDPGSGANGGDLDFASPNAYVPEFSSALIKLKKGETTDMPVKSQFGYHVIRLDDTRESQMAPLPEVKQQIEQRLGQARMMKYRDEVRSRMKTDYKFSY